MFAEPGVPAILGASIRDYQDAAAVQRYSYSTRSIASVVACRVHSSVVSRRGPRSEFDAVDVARYPAVGHTDAIGQAWHARTLA